jgi:hypothetical protein
VMVIAFEVPPPVEGVVGVEEPPPYPPEPPPQPTHKTAIREAPRT